MPDLTLKLIIVTDDANLKLDVVDFVTKRGNPEKPGITTIDIMAG